MLCMQCNVADNQSVKREESEDTTSGHDHEGIETPSVRAKVSTRIHARAGRCGRGRYAQTDE
jgi:hypothetical protein